MNCLALSMLKVETRQDSEEHIRFSKFVHSIFAKSSGKVVVWIGKKCCNNRAINYKNKYSPIGCSSYQFQLAVNKVIAESMDVSRM